MLGVLGLAAVVGIALVTLGPDHGSRAEVLGTRPAGVGVAAVPTTTGSRTTGTGAAAPGSTAPDDSPTPSSTTGAGSDPGALPQTDEKPVAAGATFDAGVQELWQAVVRDDPALAMPFFFPKLAYQQVKAIADPATDYEQRLVANYEQDIHTLHTQLGDGAASAQLVGIDVPDSQAVLVQPGEESNALSYWRVYGTTVRYSLNGATNSFPVTSLISWRGEWYVVHLGEIR
jgi:hypothetical protein